nr:hypothetical protein [Dyella sp. ASV24]
MATALGLGMRDSLPVQTFLSTFNDYSWLTMRERMAAATIGVFTKRELMA